MSIGIIAPNKSINQELPHDRIDSRLDPLVVCGKKADQGDQQGAGIELLGTVTLYKCANLRIKGRATNLLVNSCCGWHASGRSGRPCGTARRS